MNQHIYMIYDDTSIEKIDEADRTHMNLLNKGYRVIHTEVGYNSTRMEYALCNQQLSYR